MVETLDRALGAMAAPPAPTPGIHSHAYANNQQQQATVARAPDAVQLSESARDIVKQLRNSQTVAEAWLQHILEPPDPAQATNATSSTNLTGDGKEGDKGHSDLKNAFKQGDSSISWLFEAMGSKLADGQDVASAIQKRAAIDNVGVAPPVVDVVVQAEQNGKVAAVYVENLTITAQKGKVAEVSVDRVTLTAVHGSMLPQSPDAKDQPQVVDVGGELQQVASTALGQQPTDQVSVTPQARGSEDNQQQQQQRQEDPSSRLNRGDVDPRQALLIVREGGTVHPQGTVRVRMDMLLPIQAR